MTLDEPVQYQTRSPVGEAFNAAAASAVAGLVMSAAQNSLQKHKAGAAGVFSRTGGTIALFTLIGGAFAYVDATVANARHRNDGINGAAGGCAAGVVIGAASRSLPMAAGSCAGIGALLGTFEAAGATMLNKHGMRPVPHDVSESKGESPLTAFARERRFLFFKKSPQETTQNGEGNASE